MKKLMMVVLLSVLLAGCTAPPVQPTDSSQPTQQPQPRQVLLTLPEGAAAPTAGEGGRQLWFLAEGELQVQILRSLQQALEQVTGLPEEKLTLMPSGENRVETVWCSAGEGQPRIGRAVFLEEGGWCYCVSLLTDASQAQKAEKMWRSLVRSIHLA